MEGIVMSVITSTTEKVKVARPQQRKRRPGDLGPALLLGEPAFLLLLLFLIGPFFMGVWFSFTDERLISPTPAQFVGTRNYARLLQVSILTLDPLVDPATNQPLRDKNGKKSEEHTSELQSHSDLVCRLLLEKKNKTTSPFLEIHRLHNL